MDLSKCAVLQPVGGWGGGERPSRFDHPYTLTRPHVPSLSYPFAAHHLSHMVKCHITGSSVAKPGPHACQAAGRAAGATTAAEPRPGPKSAAADAADARQLPRRPRGRGGGRRQAGSFRGRNVGAACRVAAGRRSFLQAARQGCMHASSCRPSTRHDLRVMLLCISRPSPAAQRRLPPRRRGRQGCPGAAAACLLPASPSAQQPSWPPPPPTAQRAAPAAAAGRPAGLPGRPGAAGASCPAAAARGSTRPGSSRCSWRRAPRRPGPLPHRTCGSGTASRRRQGVGGLGNGMAASVPSYPQSTARLLGPAWAYVS